MKTKDSVSAFAKSLPTNDQVAEPFAIITRMTKGSRAFKLMIVAGEPSGDAHAADLVRALKNSYSEIDFSFFGAAGPKMRAEGVRSVLDTDDLAIIGLVEVGRVLPRYWRAFRYLKTLGRTEKPDAVVLVDWPEFNMKLARPLHRDGIKVIYYISPQLWAWRSYRLRGVKRDIDLMLSILPFEPQWYGKHGVDHVRFVGNPLADEIKPRYGRDEFCRKNSLDPEKPIVALLPGSRHKELDRILPLMLDAAAIVAAERPDVQFVIPLASSRKPEEAEAKIKARRDLGQPVPSVIRITSHETREALAASDAAAVASGTATLEASLIGTPLVIVYKESFINWNTLGRLISAEHYGLINLIAGERLVTELMQNDFTGESLAKELFWLLDREHNAELHDKLVRAVEKLGGPGASDRAATAVVNALYEWSDGTP